MGKAQKKTGKDRLDKYYKLAKEQGYRARSAFKLIQLNKKYSFLESARCCIDLCAAPGGWLQVASKTMPVNSLIVGVDLVAIKPVPRATTFTADITTVRCRNLLRNELKDWKADVVLHDGAPNVGTAWIQDAYAQSELVLMSLKLAVEFLIKGGTFVTKVFRSKDYNNLIWVFNQLFGKVEATKPPSSRNVSAEIFVTKNSFDPKHVFKDLDSAAPLDKDIGGNNAQANVFQPDKKRRHRDGYADNDYTLFKQIGVAEFIHASDPITVLGAVNKMTFTTEEERSWASLPLTSSDVKANLDDLKVLGKGDFKVLLKWRTALREELGLEVKTKHVEEFTEAIEVVDVVDEDEQIQLELERLNAEAASRAKRERRKNNEVKRKTIQRMQLQMTAPLDIGLDQIDAVLSHGQEDIFDLEYVERIPRVDSDEDMEPEKSKDDNSSDGEALDTDGEQNGRLQALENDLDGLYETYRERLAERDAKFKVREARQNDKRREEWSGIDRDESQADTNDEDDGGGWDEMEQRKARSDDSDTSSMDEDDELSSDQLSKRQRPHHPEAPRKKARLLTSLEEPQTTLQKSRKTDMWFSQDLFKGLDGLSEDVEEEDISPQPSQDVADDDSEPQTEFEVVPKESDDAEMWNVNDPNEDELKSVSNKTYPSHRPDSPRSTDHRIDPEHGLLTAEAVSLAQALVNRRKTKTELINDGFTRYSLNSKEGLPSWFLDDEAKHYIPNIPITKEAVQALRAKQRALDARPIKKVAEAKARKKLRAAQRLEKALKKAEGVTQTTDLTEREKAQQVEKLMRRGLANRKKKDVKVVVAKGVHKGLKGRPKGVKGRYVMVDSRMKKELRAKKGREKLNKKRKRN
ncbi:Spb1 C-terminal domain-containing protein [Russula earlei]|uniref:Spb1 C-terminal domain-containing protein n=1 Tax=Russula earlei TaxID=71964 RepID=A0ACC0U1A6_9AGAM|nr:Spb1 C-terminal domain-containing protein [Russula earlei]